MSKTALVCGCSKGIGLSILIQLLENKSFNVVFGTYRSTTDLSQLVALKEKYPSKLMLVEMDAREEQSFNKLKNAIKAETDHLDLCINSIGVLSNKQFQPERKLDEVNSFALLESFQVNTMTSLLLMQKLSDVMAKSESPIFLALSAKVGSVTDNKLGGWYSYRISKTALNMVIKNLSIELKRSNRNFTVMAIHPGTTQTSLSENFIPRVKTKYKIHTPDETAANILKIVNESKPQTHNGKFWSWEGSELPW